MKNIKEIVKKLRKGIQLTEIDEEVKMRMQSALIFVYILFFYYIYRENILVLIVFFFLLR